MLKFLEYALNCCLQKDADKMAEGMLYETGPHSTQMVSPTGNKRNAWVLGRDEQVNILQGP
jgi:hypothetical protein